MPRKPMPTYPTNLRCAACVESIRPVFDGHPRVNSWSVDVTRPGKPITIDGDLPRADVDALLRQKNYHLLDEPALVKPPNPGLRRYWPLFLILLYLLGGTACLEIAAGSFVGMRAMAHFMSGFFIVFSFFKLLNLTGFAQSYAMYDVIAKHWPLWGWLYPFVELLLGAAYLLAGHSPVVNIVTLVVMVIGIVGVAQSLLAKRTIQCACLGTVFNLPMSWVTLVEDGVMAIMAAIMLMV
jgi:hypothetical protein